MMKMVSSADSEMKKFVVNMVGCVTIREPLLLVVEYVKHGDLQTFLRAIKKQVNMPGIYSTLALSTITISML